MRHRREAGRAALVVGGAVGVTFVVAIVLLPSSAVVWAIAAALVAGIAAAAVLHRRAERTANGWGAKLAEGRWIDQPGRAGRRR